MKHKFEERNVRQASGFNRERLLLAAMECIEQLYYHLDTQFDGICEAEALERRRQYGPNSYRSLWEAARGHLPEPRRTAFGTMVEALDKTPAAVFRRYASFYTEVPSSALVPGDVLFLSRGDVVPADVRIVSARDLQVSQSLYTGHPAVTLKATVCHDGPGMLCELTALPDICLTGVEVLQGQARAVVINTGSTTYWSMLLQM